MKTRKLNTTNKQTLNQQWIRDGLLFIPDISGFTELVHSTDVLTGQQITYELLSAVLNHNVLGLQVGEIEGDAILFYRFGMAPSFNRLLKQYTLMKKAFDQKKRELEVLMATPLQLSLKVIAHYGQMTEFEIGGFKKLYGKVVIEAHRLLKNSVGSDSYMLLTDSLKEAIADVAGHKLIQPDVHCNKLCELYGGLKNVCFSYIDFSTEKTYPHVA
jgi:hypothetical protein